MDTKENELANGINGFDTEEIVNLYKFLCAYAKIEKFKNDESFKKNYPTFAQALFSMLDQLPLKPENCISIIEGDSKIKYTSAHRTKNMAFLYHFRNAIAHGMIRKNVMVEIKDFDRSTLTAYGLIDYNKTNDIITLVIIELLK